MSGARYVCVALLLAACAKKPARPVLSVFEDASEKGAATPIDARAMALALGTARPQARARLVDELTRVTDAELKRPNPLVVDLDDTQSPERARFADALRSELPAATAAVNLLGAPWSGPGLRVELGDACAPKATKCVTLFSETAVDRRAGSLAWAWSHAAVLQGADASALRAASERPDSTIALVLTGRQGTLEPSELAALQHQAQRALPHLEEDSAAHRWLEALQKTPGEWSLPFSFGEDEVLVVPRLSALARTPDFVAEIEKAGKVKWVVKPKE